MAGESSCAECQGRERDVCDVRIACGEGREVVVVLEVADERVGVVIVHMCDDANRRGDWRSPHGGVLWSGHPGVRCTIWYGVFEEGSDVDHDRVCKASTGQFGDNISYHLATLFFHLVHIFCSLSKSMKRM